jgi:hypothetical protein
LIDKRLKANEFELKHGNIQPFHPDYLFSTNGIYFLCGKMGTGKSFNVLKHILITERMFKQPYYDLIIFSATSGKLDNTVASLKQDVSTNIEFVCDKQLMPYLYKHMKDKSKYYAMVKFIINEEPNEEMLKIIQKHKMFDQMSPTISKKTGSR